MDQVKSFLAGGAAGISAVLVGVICSRFNDSIRSTHLKFDCKLQMSTRELLIVSKRLVCEDYTEGSFLRWLELRQCLLYLFGLMMSDNS
jgi:hypothetical protein